MAYLCVVLLVCCVSVYGENKYIGNNTPMRPLGLGQQIFKAINDQYLQHVKMFKKVLENIESNIKRIVNDGIFGRYDHQTNENMPYETTTNPPAPVTNKSTNIGLWAVLLALAALNERAKSTVSDNSPTSSERPLSTPSNIPFISSATNTQNLPVTTNATDILTVLPLSPVNTGVPETFDGPTIANLSVIVGCIAIFLIIVLTILILYCMRKKKVDGAREPLDMNIENGRSIPPVVATRAGARDTVGEEAYNDVPSLLDLEEQIIPVSKDKSRPSEQDKQLGTFTRDGYTQPSTRNKRSLNGGQSESLSQDKAEPLIEVEQSVVNVEDSASPVIDYAYGDNTMVVVPQPLSLNVTTVTVQSTVSGGDITDPYTEVEEYIVVKENGDRLKKNSNQ